MNATAVLLGACLLLIPGAPFLPATPGAGAPLALVLHCTLQDETVPINGSSLDQHVGLPGQVQLDFVALVSVQVTLSASLDLGWNSSVSPPVMTFRSSGSLPFNATVVIPGGTSNRTGVLTVRAEASVSGVPGDSDQDTASIVVGETSGLPPIPPPGRKASGEVRLLNMPAIVLSVCLAGGTGLAATLWLRRARRARRSRGVRDRGQAGKKRVRAPGVGGGN